MVHPSFSLSLAIGLVLLDVTNSSGLTQGITDALNQETQETLGLPADNNSPNARPAPRPTSGGAPAPKPRPAGPRSRPAAGRRVPGGGLSGGNQCPVKTGQLTAILPADAQGSTRAGQTTFWFYVPYSDTEASFGEFSLLDREGKVTLYQATFTLPKTPGFVSITLPNRITSLQRDKYYQWFLNFYCTANTSPVPDLKLNGWVIQVSQAVRFSSLGENALPGLWYDRVNDLATQLQKTPQDPTLRRQWTALLTELGLAELAPAPIVGSVILVKETP